MRSPHCRPRPDRPDRADALTAGTDRTDGLTRRLDAEAATGECRPPPPRSLRATRSAAGAVARGTGGPQDPPSPAGPSRPRFGGVRPAGVRGTAVSPGGRFASRSGTSSVGISRRCRRQWLTHSFASARRRYASGRSSVPAQRSAAAPARPVPSPDSTRTSTFCTRSSASWPPSRTRPSRKAANRTRSARCSAVNVGRSAGPGADGYGARASRNGRMSRLEQPVDHRVDHGRTLHVVHRPVPLAGADGLVQGPTLSLRREVANGGFPPVRAPACPAAPERLTLGLPRGTAAGRDRSAHPIVGHGRAATLLAAPGRRRC